MDGRQLGLLVARKAPKHILCGVAPWRALADTNANTWKHLRAKLADHRFHAVVRAGAAALAQPQDAKGQIEVVVDHQQLLRALIGSRRLGRHDQHRAGHSRK